MSSESPAVSYAGILKSLKERIRERQQRASVAVNVQLLALYWEIGTIILAQQEQEGWGAKVIKRLATDLKSEFPDMKGFSQRNLVYMQTFASAYPFFPFTQTPSAQLSEKTNNDITQTSSAQTQKQIVQAPLAQLKGEQKMQIVQAALAQLDGLTEMEITQAPLAQLSWSHHTALLDKISDERERHFYIQKAIENGWSRNVMLHQIESELYKRQGAAITNFKQTLPALQSDLACETLKSPYVFDFLAMGEKMLERDVELALTANIKKFLLELGKGFAYVGNQHNINVAGDDFFLDLLFYNTHLHCYVVFELKVGEFKPEYAGKLNFYINAVDEQVKTERDEPTIGVLLCKTPNKTVVEYALRGVEKPLGIAEYELSKALPEKLKADLPTAEELTEEMEKELPKSPTITRMEALKAKIAQLGKEEVKDQQTVENTKAIIENVWLPLHKKFEVQSKELAAEFKTLQVRMALNNSGQYTWDELLNLPEDKNRPQSIEVDYWFNGFKKAGTKAFGASMNMMLRFEAFKYTISLARDRQPSMEKLYHQLPKEQELDRLVELMLEQIMDTIDEHLNRMAV
ncbi:MAG: PDDEXK nuclease domain-containing protein [Flavobacteriales bacterium]